MDVLLASLYDYPKYSDALYGSDWRAEFEFLKACFARHARCPVRRLFEPACGTGRLLWKFAACGYEVAGNDLVPQAVDYCNARLAGHGFPPTATVGDMADFRLRRKAHAAFNTLSTFRHLASEAEAESHLRCVADALARGGIYVLGLHLTPAGDRVCDDEAWSVRRGHLGLAMRMWSIQLDRRRRRQRIGMDVDVYTPTRQFRLRSQLLLRTYTAAQFRRLLGRVDCFEIAETYDFAYDLKRPIRLDRQTEDVVFVLRKKTRQRAT